MEYQIKDIKDFPGYKVSTDGEVFSLWSLIRNKSTGRMCRNLGSVSNSLKPMINRKRGCFQLCIRDITGKRRNAKLHKLVYTTFIGETPRGSVIRHYDGDYSNNSLKNLKIGTQKDNAADRKRHGNETWGERNGHAKLKEVDIIQIRNLNKKGVSQKEIAASFCITASGVSLILSNKRWSHV